LRAAEKSGRLGLKGVSTSASTAHSTTARISAAPATARRLRQKRRQRSWPRERVWKG
jgi:hypothetical protein